MEKERFIWIFILFFASLLAVFASADVDFGGSCNGEHIVYRISIDGGGSSIKNSHASAWSDTSDGYVDVCYTNDRGHECVDFDQDGRNDNVIFRTNRDNNAHVEMKGENTSSYEDVCFGGLECSYKTSCDSSLGEECFGSVFRSKNSHIGDCDAYATKICCSPGCRINDVFWSKDGVNEVNNVNEDDVLFMVVDGTRGCAGLDLGLEVVMESSLVDNVYVADASFDTNGKVKKAWQAKRYCNRHILTCLTDPNFFFRVEFRGGLIDSDKLSVLPKGAETEECGDGKITGREICDVGTRSDNSDDIFVHDLKCDDQDGWSGSLTCDQCLEIDTSTCDGEDGECGDDLLNPGETCDGDEFFSDLTECSELKSSFGGDLECTSCKINTDECSFADLGGRKCDSCSECDDLFSGDCNQNVCVNACPGVGSCYYDPGVGEDCKSCQLVQKCEDYTNDLDCEIDRCVLLPDKPCIWEDNRCKENERCSWNCDNVYGSCLNGVKTKIGTCALVSGDCNTVLDNPALNYPNEVACLQIEEEFPVFTWFNLIMSLILLFGYYFTRFKLLSK